MRDLMTVLFFISAGCIGLAFAGYQKPSDRIYFMGALPGPGINLYSVDLNGNLVRHTHNEGSRDMDYSLDAKGNLVFTSNRVLTRPLMLRADSHKHINPKAGRAQDFNILQLPAQTFEVPDKIQPRELVSTPAQETQGNISPDGRWLAYVKANVTDSNNKTPAGEQLWLKDLVTLKEKLIADDQFIVRSDWSENSTLLVFATHNSATQTALLQFYDTDMGSKSTLYAITGEPVVIDAPQWVPGQPFVSFILHPLQADKMRQLVRLNLQARTLERLSPPDVQVQAPVSWAKDGNSVLYSALVDYRQHWDDASRKKQYEGSAQIFLSTLDGATRQLTQSETGMNLQPAFSPDNTKIAYMYAAKPPGKSGELRVMDLQGNNLATLYNKVSGLGYLRWH